MSSLAQKPVVRGDVVADKITALTLREFRRRPLFYRRDRLDHQRPGYGWFSRTPCHENSFSFNAPYGRIWCPATMVSTVFEPDREGLDFFSYALWKGPERESIM